MMLEPILREWALSLARNRAPSWDMERSGASPASGVVHGDSTGVIDGVCRLDTGVDAATPRATLGTGGFVRRPPPATVLHSSNSFLRRAHSPSAFWARTT